MRNETRRDLNIVTKEMKEAMLGGPVSCKKSTSNSAGKIGTVGAIGYGSSLRRAIAEEASWGKTWNGADAKVTSGSACVDMFGRAGSMRQASSDSIKLLFSAAWKEDKDIALKLLFYTRDIRGGYGEIDTFNIMFRELARINRESVEKNLWAVLEFGKAKDLYYLIGTPAEDAMWRFMKDQFEIDWENMNAGKSISLLAKWIATPDASSDNTKALGKMTAKKLGYSHRTMSEYKKRLRKMRKYLDLPEAKMCAGLWSEIEYSKCASKFLLKYRNVFAKKDGERWGKYIESVNKGEQKINTGTITPADIIYRVRTNYSDELETMWNNLKDVCKGNAIVMCDTSGSMTMGRNSGVAPIDVAFGLGLYLARNNKGPLKDMMINFSERPKYIELNAATLLDNYRIAERADVNYSSTNLEGAFELLLNTAKKGKVPQEDMPEAIIVVSDMQINCVYGLRDGKVTFYNAMKARYEAAGYKMPQVVFWNVNASNSTFHASVTDDGVSLVSGYSPNAFKQVMENIGTTPYDLMMAVVNSERYKNITV